MNKLHPSDSPETMTLHWAIGNLTEKTIEREFNRICEECQLTKWTSPESKNYFYIPGSEVYDDLCSLYYRLDEDCKDIEFFHALKMLAWRYEFLGLTNKPQAAW